MALPDIQDQVDEREIELDRVGIAGVQYPVRFNDGASMHSGIATFDVTVTLPADRRGTHMSRMVEIIHDELQDLEPERLPQALKVAADRLDVDKVQVVVATPMAFRVQAPASEKEAWQVCDVELDAKLIAGQAELAVTVGTDVTSLCPCSKAISDYGAHNQRSRVRLTTVGRDEDIYPLDVAAAFAMIRSVGSSPVFPLIKRPDERVVTMAAHDRPAFVEDMARDLSQACRERGIAHSVSVRNFESIHSHDAVAAVSWSPGSPAGRLGTI
ncbi:GTP cyclohydrolase FolE2 [Microlunatus panaciterrae]|uniref:GTP cyclohydrolase I n=1 Tax=Microlunatus panaciterrae TaxID=400768 RepID=A0ABS2RNN9_9ACTN|nr:GTP cyclohydrolase I [Microlunatus panaciterrae]